MRTIIAVSSDTICISQGKEFKLVSAEYEKEEAFVVVAPRNTAVEAALEQRIVKNRKLRRNWPYPINLDS